MNKILIPTDFSPVADNALEYAIHLSAGLQSDVLLYHVYTFYRKIDYDPNYTDDSQPYVKSIQRKMNAKQRQYQELVDKHGVTLQTEIDEDNVYSLFSRKVDEHCADMIVMGSKGASAIERVLFGSVAAAALEMSEIPVLIVPPEFRWEGMDNIALAIDDKDIDPTVLEPLCQIARAFGAKITIFNVTSKEVASSEHPIQKYLEDLDTSYMEIPISGNLSDSVNEFVEENGKHLLCMVRRNRHFFESLFKRSATKTQLHNSSVPLLVLPERKE